MRKQNILKLTVILLEMKGIITINIVSLGCQLTDEALSHLILQNM